MDDPDLTVDPDGLRNLAADAERVAEAIRGCTVPDLAAAAMPGSAVAHAVAVAGLDGLRHALAAEFARWAATARATADTLTQADGAAAHRLVR